MRNLTCGVSASSNRSRNSSALDPHNASNDTSASSSSRADSPRNGKAPARLEMHAHNRRPLGLRRVRSTLTGYHR